MSCSTPLQFLCHDNILAMVVRSNVQAHHTVHDFRENPEEQESNNFIFKSIVSIPISHLAFPQIRPGIYTQLTDPRLPRVTLCNRIDLLTSETPSNARFHIPCPIFHRLYIGR